MNATVAQLVEYDLAKVGVAGSNPVCRSLLRRSGAKVLLLFYCNFVIEYVKMSKSIIQECLGILAARFMH